MIVRDSLGRLQGRASLVLSAAAHIPPQQYMLARIALPSPLDWHASPIHMVPLSGQKKCAEQPSQPTTVARIAHPTMAAASEGAASHCEGHHDNDRPPIVVVVHYTK